MASFQTTILAVAVVLLILTLIYMAYSINKTNADKTWPPLIGDCPDYWTAVTKEDLAGLGISSASLGAGPFCANVKNLGTCPAKAGDKHQVMDFTGAEYTGSKGNCQKYKWATKCGVTWDGITYGVSNPCDKDINQPDTSNWFDFGLF